MKVAIILYSGTGNTRSVAERLATKVRARGHQTEIREVTVTGDPGKGANGFQLPGTPPMDDADIAVLASPVMAFSLSPVMKAYLDRTKPPLRPVLVVITQHFPRPWMGGRHALKSMRRAIERRGGFVGEATPDPHSERVSPDFIAPASSTRAYCRRCVGQGRS